MATKEFHQNAKTWARIKHELLGRYLSLFLGKLGKTSHTAYYVDAFAGPGLLEDGSAGSALVAANCAVNPSQKSRRETLKCINVEADPEVFARLDAATAGYQETGAVVNFHGKFEQHLKSITDLIGDSPTLFFIDPFGTEGAEISTLKQLKKPHCVREALIRYDDTRVKRLASWSANNIGNLTASAKKTAEKFKLRAHELSSANALQEWLNGDSNARENLIAGYINEVIRQGVFKFGISYPIRNPDTLGHRYFLVHFCDFEDGFVHMANFMALAERTWQTRDDDLFGPPAQPEFLAIKESLKQDLVTKNVERIRSALPQICMMRRWGKASKIQNRKILAAIVKELGWTVTRAECIRALKELGDQGLLRLEGREDYDYTVLYLVP